VPEGLLLQRSGGHGASPRRVPRRNRLTAWTFPPIAADPEKRRKRLSSPSNPDTPTVWPAWRLDRFANPVCSWANPRTIPIDRTAPPEGFTIPVPLHPHRHARRRRRKLLRTGCRASRPARRPVIPPSGPWLPGISEEVHASLVPALPPATW